MPATRRRFRQEFKNELCREVTDSSKPVKTVATDYGVGDETLRNWLKKHKEAHGGAEKDLNVSERARLKELERENQERKAEAAFLKSGRIVRKSATVVAKYEFIDSYTASTPKGPAVLKMCRWLEVSRSGF